MRKRAPRNASAILFAGACGALRTLRANVLRAAGYVVLEMESLHGCWHQHRRLEPDLVMLGVVEPFDHIGDALAVIRRIRSLDRVTPIIMMASDTPGDVAKLCLSLGLNVLLPLSCSVDEMLAATKGQMRPMARRFRGGATRPRSSARRGRRGPLRRWPSAVAGIRGVATRLACGLSAGLWSIT